MSKIILCADDSVTMQKVAEITFKSTDFTYVGARSVDEALEKARAQKPALVLADAVMQGKSGYDLCLALKQDGKLADVPVVILCGNSAPFDTGRGAQVGADGTLAKPWDTQVMLEKCLEFVEKAKAGTVKPGQAAPAATPMASAKPAPAPVAAAPAPISAPAPAAAKPAPPRSATIMGMPTIKLPGGGTGPAPAPVAPAPVAPAPAPAMKGPAPVAAAPVAAAPAPAAAAAANLGLAFAGSARAPMVSGMPSKKSQIVERTLARMSERLAEASGLAVGSPELAGLLRLSTEVVERVVWEVVPELAEQIIRENLAELTARRAN